ncbi:MAG TPA: hypothetical protein VGD67_04135 [Pseudonocardiaceae bacterium]
MSWHKQLPFAVYSVLMSIGVGVILWLTKITSEEAAVLAAIGLELVVITHRVHHDLGKITDPVRGLIRTTQLDDALESARAILRSKNPHARALLESTTAAYATRVKELSTGWATFSPADFMEWIEDLFTSARPGHTLHATSHLAGGEYWKRNYGKRYEALNRSAVMRGLAIQRIYLLRDDEHIQQHAEILDRQSEFADIRVVTFDSDDTTMSPLRRDFFVYNNEVAAEFHFSQPGMELSHLRVTTEPEQVRKLAGDYARMRDTFSRPYVRSRAVPGGTERPAVES